MRSHSHTLLNVETHALGIHLTVCVVNMDFSAANFIRNVLILLELAPHG